MVKCESWTEKTKLDVLHMSKGADNFRMAWLSQLCSHTGHTLDDPVEPVTNGLFSHTWCWSINQTSFIGYLNNTVLPSRNTWSLKLNPGLLTHCFYSLLPCYIYKYVSFQSYDRHSTIYLYYYKAGSMKREIRLWIRKLVWHSAWPGLCTSCSLFSPAVFGVFKYFDRYLVCWPIAEFTSSLLPSMFSSVYMLFYVLGVSRWAWGLLGF